MARFHVKTFGLSIGFSLGFLLHAIELNALPLSFPDGAVIQDAEVSDILSHFSTPILQKAGLSRNHVKIILIATPVINAASTIGGFILINTGLIMQCDNGQELAAVLAHEIGHVQKHHVISLHSEMDNASKMGLGALGLGAIVSALTGNPGALMLGAMGGQHVAERSFLQFSRAKESEADEASFGFLNALGWPVQGSVSFMQKLMAERGPLSDSRIVYTQTHPLHEDRINRARVRVKQRASLPTLLEQEFQRLKVKIRAYSLPVLNVLKDPIIQASPYALYGQAIGSYRQGKIDEALQKLELLRGRIPSAYLDEMCAQLLFEKGHLKPALAKIEAAMAARLKPHPTFYTLAARIHLGLGDETSLKKAHDLLEKAIHLDPDDPQLWRFLSMVEGKQGTEGERLLSLAQEALLLGDRKRANSYVASAEKKLSRNTPAYRRAQDLMAQLKHEGDT